jgi:molecular chaperone GrpE
VDYEHHSISGSGTSAEAREMENVTDKKENPFEEPVEIEVKSPPAAAGVEAGNGLPVDDIDGDLDPESEALAQAAEEVAKHREATLRMHAEMENLRKRLNRELERSRRFALERIMKDLLQVRDSLERGLELSGESLTVEGLREGQELTLKMLGKVMQDHNLEIIDPEGQPFDPEFHEAMTVMPSEEVEENTVIEVLQKGFRLHDRLIRPAMVVVSRKP